MNKKGFTLMEILAVIIILALLVLITSTVVTKVVKDAKNDISNTQKKLIKSATQTWGSENIDRLPKVGECAYLTLENLKKDGFLESSIIDSNTGKEIPDNTKIKITASKSSNNLLIYDYEVGSEDTSTCPRIPFGITGTIYVNTSESVAIGHSINRETRVSYCGHSGNVNSCSSAVAWDTEKECESAMASAGYNNVTCTQEEVTTGLTSYETDPSNLDKPYYLKYDVKNGIIIASYACMKYSRPGVDEKEFCVRGGDSNLYGSFAEINNSAYVRNITNPTRNVAVVDSVREYFGDSDDICYIFRAEDAMWFDSTISIRAYSGGSVGVYMKNVGNCSISAGSYFNRSFCTIRDFYDTFCFCKDPINKTCD